MDHLVAEYLDSLVREVAAVLGADLLGVYAAGSVATGAYEPGRSDVDVAVVTRSSVTDVQKSRLVDRLRHEHLPCPARGLELVVYHEDVAASGAPEPGFELELNTGTGMVHRVTLQPEDRAAADGDFWYGIDRSILHASGLALTGPPAPEVFADVDSADLQGLLVTALEWWLDRTPPGPGPTPGADDAVLGACRALLRHREGRWVHKVAAGRRLVELGDPDSAVIARAVEARGGGEQPGGAAARAFQQRVLDEIRVGAG